MLEISSESSSAALPFKMNRDLKVGSKVRRRFTSESDEDMTEVGVVVHLWMDPETELQDAWIAFFGEEFPKGKPAEKPVILRYFASGLEVIE